MSNKVEKSGAVPKLRFPEFLDSGEWKTEPLSNMAKRCTQKNGQLKLSRVLTNSAEFGVIDQRDYFDKEIANQSNLAGYFVVEKGDYVYNPRISTSAPVGPISKNNLAAGVMSPLYTVFRFNNSQNDFYGHYFKSHCWHYYLRQASSVGARHDRMAITNENFMAMPLPVASQEELQKIADCFTSLNEIIALGVKKLQTLQAHKNGLLQKLFPAEGEILPKLRFPEFLDAGEWEIKSFDEMFSIGNGKDYKHLQSGAIPVYGSGGYMLSVNDYLHDGDSVCIGRKGTINNPFFLTGKFWTVDTLFYTYSFKGCLPRFVYSIFQKINWLKHNEAGGVPSLSKTNISKINTAIPKLAEQQKIADCFISIDELIALEAKKIDALKAYKEGMMQRLFPAVDEVTA